MVTTVSFRNFKSEPTTYKNAKEELSNTSLFQVWGLEKNHFRKKKKHASSIKPAKSKQALTTAATAYTPKM